MKRKRRRRMRKKKEEDEEKEKKKTIRLPRGNKRREKNRDKTESRSALGKTVTFTQLLSTTVRHNFKALLRVRKNALQASSTKLA